MITHKGKAGSCSQIAHSYAAAPCSSLRSADSSGAEVRIALIQLPHPAPLPRSAGSCTPCLLSWCLPSSPGAAASCSSRRDADSKGGRQTALPPPFMLLRPAPPPRSVGSRSRSNILLPPLPMPPHPAPLPRSAGSGSGSRKQTPGAAAAASAATFHQGSSQIAARPVISRRVRGCRRGGTFRTAHQRLN